MTRSQSDIESAVVQRIADTPVAGEPMPHIVVDEIFPPDFYAELLANIPGRSHYTKITETKRTTDAYENRLILHLKTLDGLPAAQRAFWEELARWFLDSGLASALVKKFQGELARAIGKDLRGLSYGTEGMLVKDLDGYFIGPHTDVRSRAVSLLFYLPADDRQQAHGTTLYRPHDRTMTSDGSRHLGFAGFEPVSTVPFRPNAMLGFPRTDASFHGVAPIDAPGIERDLLLYILRWSG
ncbi:MAG TPA: hypothetical protein VL966_03955 [Alphaproteobacteria bacterium]|jgi:hypothetical protein|nr:hypothetical protein [Alphaproteobacteria bacterium]